jgi:large subunit ribosomal protein L1
MGKIRVKTLGDEKTEKQQKDEAKKRAEAKRIEELKATASQKEEAVEATPSAESVEKTEDAPEKKETKKKDFKTAKSKHSQKYVAVAGLVEKKKVYSLKEALAILPTLKITSFDETVELHVNTTETGVSGSVTLPHGTGKQTRVVIADQTNDPKAVDDLVKAVESGKIDFDILIATPDAMPKLARVAKFLGPRGLMPNPKNGTVTPKPMDVAKKFEGGQMNFKTEAKFPLLHLTVGKLSFGEKKLEENIKTMISTLPANKIKTITLKSTMSPGLKIDIASA